MKRHCFIVFFLLMFFLLPSAEAFSLQTVDGDVREVLRSAARMGGINLVLDDTVRGKVTIELQETKAADKAEADKAITEAAHKKALSD